MNLCSNIEKFKNSKLIKNSIAGVLSATVFLSLAGCGDKKEDTVNSEVTESSTIDSKVNTVSDAELKMNEIKSKFADTINSKFYLSCDDLSTTLTIFNIDYIVSNDIEYLHKIYPNGLNSNKELKDYETFISKYREYNTNIKNENEFFTISEYALNESDKKIINKLENITKELINLVNNDKKNKRIEEIFELMTKFYDGKDISIEGEKINKDDLSNGFNITSEVFGQIVSVYTQNIISENKRTKLDDMLKQKDRRDRVILLLETFGNTTENMKNTYIEGNDTYILGDEDKAIINEFNQLCAKVKDDLNKKSIILSEDQIYSLVLIRNIDYLASDSVEAGVLKTIVGSRKVEEVLSEAKKSIAIIEKYNMNVKVDDTYKYSFSMNNTLEEQKINDISILGAIKLSHNLKDSIKIDATENEILYSDKYQTIMRYNAYSNDATINYNNYKVTKNDTGYGTRYITDAIYYNTLKQYKYQNKSFNKYVNDTDPTMSSINPISWAIDNKCSEYEFVK